MNPLHNILAIDPSKAATGVVFMGPGPDLWSPWVIRKGRKLQDHEAERVIARSVKGILEDIRPDIVAIEVPTSDNAQRPYIRKDGSRGQRAFTSASQWRLIGRLLQVCEASAVTVRVSQHDAKRALGLNSLAKKANMIAAAERLLGTAIKGYKYERETIADCIGIGLAGYGQCHDAVKGER